MPLSFLLSLLFFSNANVTLACTNQITYFLSFHVNCSHIYPLPSLFTGISSSLPPLLSSIFQLKKPTFPSFLLLFNPIKTSISYSLLHDFSCPNSILYLYSSYFIFFFHTSHQLHPFSLFFIKPVHPITTFLSFLFTTHWTLPLQPTFMEFSLNPPPLLYTHLNYQYFTP